MLYHPGTCLGSLARLIALVNALVPLVKMLVELVSELAELVNVLAKAVIAPASLVNRVGDTRSSALAILVNSLTAYTKRGRTSKSQQFTCHRSPSKPMLIG